MSDLSSVPYPALVGSTAPDPANWSCTVGEYPRGFLPPGSDAPMREVVREGYRRLTGREPDYIFSGWGDPLPESYRAVHENRMPDVTVLLEELIERHWQLSHPESVATILRRLPEEAWKTLVDLVGWERER